MPPTPALRRPVSTRHAFALAFDLTLLRDPVHSVLVPFLARAPWILAVLLLPAEGNGAFTPAALVNTAALVGGSISWWAVDAMLRVRARSVFNTPHGVPPTPAAECYRQGMRRLPWLYLTEFVRGVALAFGFSAFVGLGYELMGFLRGAAPAHGLGAFVQTLALIAGFGVAVLPGIYLAYRLAFSTEAVVLNDRNLFGAFEHSFHLSHGRFERWLEMIVVSVLLVLALLFTGTVLSLAIHWLSFDTWKTVTLLLLVAIWPVFQYAWTFFYLRLIELEDPRLHAAGPFQGASGLGGPWQGSPPHPSRPTPDRQPAPPVAHGDGIPS